MEDVPRWRTHGGDFFYAQPYNDALIFGDSRVPLSELSQRLLADPAFSIDSTRTRRLVEARLATVNLTDAAAIAATHGTASCAAWTEERTAAIDALERDASIRQAHRARPRSSTRSVAPP